MHAHSGHMAVVLIARAFRIFMTSGAFWRFAPECARIQNIQDTFLRPEYPECARIQGKIRTLIRRPEYPERTLVQDALPPS